MYDFENEGIYITPTGYFTTKWNSNNRTYDACSLNEDEIPLHLNSNVYLIDGIRLKHIFEPLLNEPIYNIIFQSDFWKEIMSEIKRKDWTPWIGDHQLKKDIDGREIEYIEIYKILEISEKKSEVSDSGWAFHGIGYPYIDPQLAQENYCKVGERTSYAVEFKSMAELMNTPFKVGETIVINEDIEDYTKQKIITSTNNYLTLYELIHSIIWEMSFCGDEDSRTSFSDNLIETKNEIDFEIENNNGDLSKSTKIQSFTPVDMDKFFDELNKQHQEEEFKKISEKLNVFLESIKDNEILEKFKTELKNKLNF